MDGIVSQSQYLRLVRCVHWLATKCWILTPVLGATSIASWWAASVRHYYLSRPRLARQMVALWRGHVNWLDVLSACCSSTHSKWPMWSCGRRITGLGELNKGSISTIGDEFKRIICTIKLFTDRKRLPVVEELFGNIFDVVHQLLYLGWSAH